jgi:AbrB family looped-hinge helix DNA binding protein
MTMTTTISSKGQITVPVEIRRSLGLVPGTKLELALSEPGTFVVRKAAGGSFFASFQGIGRKARVPYVNSREAMDILRGPVGKGDLA